MTVAAIPGLDPAPTTHEPLLAWVRRVAELTTPDRVVWCDGSEREWRSLTDTLVEAGTFVRLPNKPNSFWCATAPDDAGPVEEHTFVCSRDEADAGPANWMDPLDAKIMLTEHYRDCMTGRTMYVVPFCLGSLTAGKPVLGVQITDSPYVVASMHLTTRAGADPLALCTPDTTSGTGFVRCLHSVGAPLKPGQTDVPWPRDHTRYVSCFPEERMIWSYGSGHVDRTGVALRLASAIARDEGWLAEHMAILKLTTPDNRVHYLAAAFPSACGTTTLAMLEPTIPGWTIELVSDDIAWLRFGTDGRLYATNPETGIHGLAPGTGWQTNPNAMRTLHRGNTIYTNTSRTNDGDVWWEGHSQAPPDHLTTWQHTDWTLAKDWARGTPTAHPNARYTTPIGQCPVTAPEWSNPRGVPISAILFGSRRSTTVPLVVESRDWQHGVFLGATLFTENTASQVRRDPMAMHAYLGYHVGDYLQHWLNTGAGADPVMLPKIFAVNWFRRDSDGGGLLWPGSGENARVLKWIVERLDSHDTNTPSAVETPVGWVPTLTALDLDGLDIATEGIQAALTVDLDEWRAELPLIENWFTTIIDKLPSPLRDELDKLKHHLA
jgi:phosphoenolpyruvate carboxykinase (GTP)